MSSDNLTFEELTGTDKAGIHETKAPILGFKKIECVCSNNPWWAILGSSFSATNGVATLVIPTGAKIVRPAYTLHVTKKVRTDNAKFINYEPYALIPCKRWIIDDLWRRLTINIWKKCYCYSIFYENYEYQKNKNNQPKEPLDLDIEKECGSGINFFLNKDHAKDYQGI